LADEGEFATCDPVEGWQKKMEPIREVMWTMAENRKDNDEQWGNY
jgi:hypothetical protein